MRAGLEDAGERGAAPGGHGHRGDHRGGEAKYPDVVDPLEPARALNKRPVRAKIKHPVEWNGKLHPSLPLTPLYCLRIHKKIFTKWVQGPPSARMELSPARAALASGSVPVPFALSLGASGSFRHKRMH